MKHARKNFERAIDELVDAYRGHVTPARMLLALEKQMEIVNDELWREKTAMQGEDPEETSHGDADKS